MKSFSFNLTHFFKIRFNSFGNPSIDINLLLYYNSCNHPQKDALIWTGGGNIVNTPGGFVLIYGILDFTIPLPFPSGSQCIVLQSTSLIQQSIFLNLGTDNISFMYASRSGGPIGQLSSLAGT